jgi:hypothetical protein
MSDINSPTVHQARLFSPQRGITFSWIFDDSHY